MLLCPSSLPWNQTSAFDYFIEGCILAVMGFSFILVSGTLLLFFSSLCIHYHAFYEMYRNSIENWNNRSKKRLDEPFLCDLIRFHLVTKESVLFHFYPYLLRAIWVKHFNSFFSKQIVFGIGGNLRPNNLRQIDLLRACSSYSGLYFQFGMHHDEWPEVLS